MPDSSDTDLGVSGQAPETQSTEQYRIPVVIEGEGVEIADLPPDPSEPLDPEIFRQRCEELVAWRVEPGEHDLPEDDWSTSARWPDGIYLSEFIDYLSPDLARRVSACGVRRKNKWWIYEETSPIPLNRATENFGDISERLKRRILNLRYSWEFGRGAPQSKPDTLDAAIQQFHAPARSDLEDWDRRTRYQMYGIVRDLILEKTEPCAGFLNSGRTINVWTGTPSRPHGETR